MAYFLSASEDCGYTNYELYQDKETGARGFGWPYELDDDQQKVRFTVGGAQWDGREYSYFVKATTSTGDIVWTDEASIFKTVCGE